MAEPSQSQRVLQIAQQMRSIVKSSTEHFGEEGYPDFQERMLSNGWALLDRARQAGALADLDVALCHELDRQKELHPRHGVNRRLS